MFINVKQRSRVFNRKGDSFRVMPLIKENCFVLIILIFCVTFSSSNKNDYTSDPCNSNGTTHQVEVQFSSKIVQNEYIVAFDRYYQQHTREIYLTAAFSKVSFSVLGWVQPTDKPNDSLVLL